jgi:hypothetical protein
MKPSKKSRIHSQKLYTFIIGSVERMQEHHVYKNSYTFRKKLRDGNPGM